MITQCPDEALAVTDMERAHIGSATKQWSESISANTRNSWTRNKMPKREINISKLSDNRVAFEGLSHGEFFLWGKTPWLCVRLAGEERPAYNLSTRTIMDRTMFGTRVTIPNVQINVTH
jgi:hypothetical protein